MDYELRTYSTAEISEMFGLGESYLRKLRQLRKGPKYSKLGRLVRYRKEDVEEWLRLAMVEVSPRELV
ncbi:MAG: helix-turn-helix domain-containing protein [Candidatus Aenigmarchaeota archaeon]|nr:helix-turn-helix domain-containing protein [Candidatus Aenigmarchaeota archaeon]